MNKQNNKIKPEENNAKKAINAKTINKKNSLFHTIMPVAITSSAILFLYLFMGNSSAISGKIIIDNDEKTPLKDVTITVDSNITPNNPDDNTFKINGLKHGTHNLSFHKDGFKDFTEDIEVNEDVKLVISMTEKRKDIQNENIFSNSIIALSQNSDSLNLISPKENKNLISGKVIKGYALNHANNKLYISSSLEGTIYIIDYTTGKEIKRIKFDSGITLGKIIFFAEKNMLFVELLNKNTIAVVDTSNDEIFKKEINIKSAEPISDLLINHENNKTFIFYNSKIASYSQFKDLFDTSIDYKDLKGNNDIKKVLLYKNILLMLNPINKEIIKFDLYTNNQSSIPFNSTPEDMTLTKDGSLYVSSPQGVLNSVNIETGSISPYNTNLDISGIKYANDEIYILEKNSKSMSIFNINKKELKKEKIDLGTVTKEITFFNE